LADTNKSQYQIDKELFENALAQKSISLFNEFITQRPDTVWMENARYYRDKLALASAKSAGTEEALNQFLQDYPGSAWVDNAIYHRDRLAREGKKKSLLERSQEISRLEAKFDAASRSHQSAEKSLSSEQLRVQKALAIYEQINKEKQLAAANAEKLRKREEKKKRDCIVLNDKLRSYDERRLWYNLDDDGNRIYLSDEAVQQSKLSYSRVVERRCGGV
jgi:hypothetical protein